MTAKVEINCDAHCCLNSISNDTTTDDVQATLKWHKWHNDPTTDEYHYCDDCWPAVKQEYDDMKTKGELS